MKFDRLAGLAGLGFVALVIVEQILRGAPPMNDAPASAIAQYYLDSGALLALSSSAFALSVPLVLMYAVGLFNRLRTVAGEPWARIGLGGAQVLIVSFGLVFAMDVATNALAAEFASQPALITLLFKLHAAAFTLNMVILGVALGGFGLAALVGEREPRWLAALGILGGGLLIVSAVPALPVVQGSLWVLAGFAGFACWLAWVTITSVRMLRDRSLRDEAVYSASAASPSHARA